MFEFGDLLNSEELEALGISKFALVSKTAQIGKNVKIGPNAQIGPKVILENDVKIASSAIISGKTKLGKGTEVYSFATIGTTPQDKKYNDEDTSLIIGEYNKIREYVNISIGTETGQGSTNIGDHNLIMAFCHIAHDCNIGNQCIFANGVHLAGHVTVQDYVVFGGMSGAHQFCFFGEFAMIGAGSIVVMNVAPYVRVQGDRSTVRGINSIGISRGGFSAEDLKEIKKMYRILFKSNLVLSDSIDHIKREIKDGLPKNKMLSFLNSDLVKSQRGLCR